MAVCLMFFFYSSQKPHSNRVFPRFNHSSIVNYVINNRWHLILSRRSNLVDLLQNIKFFSTARLTAWKKTSYSCSTKTKCLNDEKLTLGFSYPLKWLWSRGIWWHQTDVVFPTWLQIEVVPNSVFSELKQAHISPYQHKP